MKKKSDEWECVYCSISWSADVKSNKVRKWIECDKCQKKMHTTCVPKKHKESIMYDSDNSSDEVQFSCEFCKH